MAVWYESARSNFPRRNAKSTSGSETTIIHDVARSEIAPSRETELFTVFAKIDGEKFSAFLGSQGDPWDTQWDMFLALIGAVISLALVQRWHDKQLNIGQ